MSDGWRTEKLGDLCEIELGKTPARANKTFWDEERETTNVWLSIADLLSAEDNIVVDSKEYLSDNGAAISKTVRKGTLLVSFKLTLGRLAFAGRDLFTNEAIAALTIRDERELSKEFLFYFLHFFDWRKAAENDVKLKGMTLNKAKLKQIAVHFPAPAEQQRIVGILDEAFDGIATAKANAQQNFHNSHALFESSLQAVVDRRGEGWVDRRLGDVCSIARGGSPRPIQKYLTTDPNGINWIKISDATASGKYIYKTRQKIIAEGASRSRVVHEGDFLLSNSMSFGRPYIMRTTGCIHDGWLVLTDYAAHLDQDFLYHVLGSQVVFRQFDRLAAGSTVRNLNIELASRVDIPVPPMDRQREIAKRFDILAAETQHLESIYQRKLAALEELKKSLLHQAFTGQLGAPAA